MLSFGACAVTWLSLIVRATEELTLNVDGKSYAVSERMRFHHVPGCSIVQIENFKVKSILNYGFVSEGSNKTVSQSTLFPTGQMGEPVAHLLALQLVDQGVLSLDSPVRKRLKRYSPPIRGTELTLRHLLLGRGGYTMPKYMGHDADAVVPNLIDELNQAKVSFDPGTQWARSPENISVIQILMEDATGKSINQLLVKGFPRDEAGYWVHQPLGQSASFAVGHDERGQVEPNGGRAYPELAAMGLWMTPKAYGRFLSRLMANTHGPSRDLLSASSAQLLFKPMETIGQDGKISHLETMTFGSDEFAGRRLFLRGGATRGFYCQSWLNPAKGNAVIVFTNRQLAFLFANEVRDSLLSKI